MGKTERYDLQEDLANDTKKHDNPNHMGGHKNVLNLSMADEQLKDWRGYWESMLNNPQPYR